MGRILVADDHDSLRRGIVRALSDARHEVDEAPNGNVAIEKLHEGQYDVVLSDIDMPRMNGLEMLEAIKRDGKNANLPCVMLTTECQPQLIERAKKAGAKGCIIKPFKAELLVAAVTKLVAQR